MAAGDASAFGRKGVAYRVTFPILDADGDLVTGATGLDSEVSKDGGTFADCTNEATEIATSSGVYYLDLTSTEMNADTVAVIVKTTSSGAKTTTLVIYPLKDGDIVANMTQVGGQTASASGTVTFPGTIASSTNITAASGITLAAVTHTGATIPTVTSVTNGVTASTVSDKTGYSLASSQSFNTTGSVGSVTGNVGGSVGSVAAGVTVSTNNDKTGYSLATTPPTSAQVATAVWDSLLSAHTTAGTFGGRIPRSDSSNVEVKLTGSAHIAADIHELQPAVIEAQHFAPDAIDAAALAADAVAKITASVLTTAMTESYRGTNAAPTLAQAAFELIAHMGEASISGTTKTLKKLDGSTTAKTYTLDSSTTPTSITETT